SVVERRRREELAELEAAAAADPEDRAQHFQIGLAWLAAGDREKAETALRQAVRRRGRLLPQDHLATAYCRLAECSLERGDMTEATREARSA
ncbi:tetratricopeptide repeat protein, partial [Alkalihalophilus lindianensis]